VGLVGGVRGRVGGFGLGVGLVEGRGSLVGLGARSG
jgi:hypothetical protein